MPIIQAEPEIETEQAGINPRAVIGGNEPPLEERIGMEFREALLGERTDFIARMDGAIDAVSRARVSDDETLGKAGDLDKILRACEGHISDTHKAVKQPYLDAARAADAEKNRLTVRVSDARFVLRDRMNAFMAEREAARRAEEARIAAVQRAKAEEAARAEHAAREAEADASRAIADAASAEERIAAQKAADEAARVAHDAIEAAQLSSARSAISSGPVRSDAGASVSGRTVWHSEVQDFAKAFKSVKSNPKVQEAISAAVAGLVRAGTREIAGVKIWSTVSTVAR